MADNIGRRRRQVRFEDADSADSMSVKSYGEEKESTFAAMYDDTYDDQEDELLDSFDKDKNNYY